MKWILVTFVLILSLSFITEKATENKKLKTPPGTVKLNDSLFIDKTEIANVHWREFIMSLVAVEKDSIAANNNLPDSMVWYDNAGLNHKPFLHIYYRHPTFNYYPVVGISYEQAVAFCKWRSKTVNNLFTREPKQNPFPGKKYKYRLPTIAEWEIAAENISLEDIPKKFKDKKMRINLANVCEGNIPIEFFKASSYTTNVETYQPNRFGAFNMIGNVSEMTVTKGIAKGGNFLLPLDSCKIKNEQHYTKPEVWLGFRCVCEIVN